MQLFIKCASEHTFRFRIFAVKFEVCEKIDNIARFKSKQLNMWTVKFLKTIIKVKDDAFSSFIIKKNFLR